jgi:hypothetical protein
VPFVLLLLCAPAVTKQRRQTFVSGINSLRGTLPWIAPEIVKHPETVTEKVSSTPPCNSAVRCSYIAATYAAGSSMCEICNTQRLMVVKR